MGLDMYLTKHIYVGAEYKHRNVTGTIDIKVNNEPLPVNFSKVFYIVEKYAYWRKANAIHRWFVDNCQDGVDDCRETYVSREQLNELVDICKEIKENPARAPELLPIEDGFFFGEMEYGEWYMEDIDNTIEQLSNIDNETDGNFYYHASW